MSKYVIIGGSAAGMGAIEAIREADQVGAITLVSEELCPYYSRPMISELVSGKANFDKMKCREDTFWQSHNVNALTGRKALHVDMSQKLVKLDKGESVTFEKLLIATGGKPFVPTIEGANKDDVLTFTTLSDAELLDSKLKTAKSVVVIGAGLIGVSVTEALVDRGLKVTMVELKDYILNLILDEYSSEMIQNVIAQAGVTIVTGQTVKKILGKPENSQLVGGVLLTNGDRINCDLVIVAIGVIPRKDLVVNTMVKTNRGILVDKTMSTNISGVYASGDVVEAYDFLIKENRLLPLWPLAHLEGKIAGYNMAGKRTIYEGGTAMSSLKYFDMPIISFGITNPKEKEQYEILVECDQEKKIYKKILLKNNVIVGLTFVNDIKKTGVFFHLLKNAVNVKKFKSNLLSENFGLATLPSSLRKKFFGR
ncbi:MAG TPA: FAD-dependent oxidoreductase [Candidatus Glassbacteria bacterium]|nr:FAD-dependent oxidoreductase [Candidatus Glassbacteria bacterium]